ncbi:MAG: ABC transporter permease subunit, partial [Clostridiales bacterium]|nr:ABC transporter permease subunit [Clostridiales bacterium]
TLQGAVIAAAVVSFPLMYRAARGAFEQLDQDLVHAGRTLGLSEFVIFRRIMLPNCWPGIAAGAILAFARALGEYGATSMLAGNIPGKTQTMSLAIASAVAGNNRDRATLWVVIIMGISLVTMVLMNLLTSVQGRAKREAKA